MFRKLAVKGLVLGLVVSSAFAQEMPDRLVLGMVPSREADRVVDNLQPIADMLSQELQIPVEPFVGTNYTAMVEAIGTGTVDLGLLGPLAVAQAIVRHDARAVIASERRGSLTYKSQFNVRCDSGIDDFEDLRGRTIAFVDPASASGYFVPFLFLRDEHGINPNADMQSIFAGSHDAAVIAVYNGDVDVAVSFDDARTVIEGDFPDVMEEVCILGYTGDMPNDGMVVRSGIPDELTQRIADAFIRYAETEEGRAVTEELFNVTAFVPADNDFYASFIEVVRSFER